MSDPKELAPVSEHLERKKTMLAELERRIERGALSRAPSLTLDAAEIEHLRALGYGSPEGDR